MDGVVREVSARVLGRGLELYDENEQMWQLNQLLFADDTALVADSEAKLQRLVTEFRRVCERRKLRVNTGKSKVMRCSRRRDGGRTNVVLNGTMLEEVDCFKYLGSHVTAEGAVDAEVSHRVKEAAKVMGGLKKVINSRSLGMEAKRTLYEGIVVPTVLYGAETWGLREDERRRLDVLEMKCLRSMCGVTRLDRIRNEEIRRRTREEKELSARVDQRVLSWFGHMERMDKDRVVNRIMRSHVKGVRPRGRPRYGWSDGAKRALESRGLSIDEGRVRTRDRREWRMIVYD
jgi:Reverse transcriptase (RNA-dependent DNA polymerase).